MICLELGDFDIGQILECGQVFRFVRLGDGHYEIVAFGRVLQIEQSGGNVKFWYPHGELDELEFAAVWRPYFDLDRDYGAIKALLCADPIMEGAINFAPGIRILRQNPWETIISFIISQNNRIPQIQRVIANICEAFGEAIPGGRAFPMPEALAAATPADLRRCKTGFRDKYIIAAARAYLAGIRHGDSVALRAIPGIGEKVAHCIMLFGYGQHDSFPVDVWVRRAMSRLYFKDAPTTPKDIQTLAQSKFGQYAGFAQQYLFHYIRSNPQA